MGKVRSDSVKAVSRRIVKEYGPFLSPDSFDHNKDIVSKVSTVGSKRFRNQIAGYVTHLCKLKKLQEQSYEE
jgi:small subunit ribosomal protein S17e